MSDYKPISCEFHDVLESLATRDGVQNRRREGR
jgi:transcriptional antiterminator Rof (Rho-off)